MSVCPLRTTVSNTAIKTYLLGGLNIGWLHLRGLQTPNMSFHDMQWYSVQYIADTQDSIKFHLKWGVERSKDVLRSSWLFGLYDGFLSEIHIYITAPLTYLRPKSCKCCPMSRMTSSSHWDSRFFFLPPELASFGLLLLDAGCADTPLLLLLTVFPLLVTDTSPLEWAAPAEEDSPFCAPFWQDTSESVSCPAPLACIFSRLIRVKWCVCKRLPGATGHCGEKKSTGTAADGPTDPDAAPNCPVPLRPILRVFFRGDDRDEKPFSDTEDEATESRVISTTSFCECWW